MSLKNVFVCNAAAVESISIADWYFISELKKLGDLSRGFCLLKEESVALSVDKTVPASELEHKDTSGNCSKIHQSLIAQYGMSAGLLFTDAAHTVLDDAPHPELCRAASFPEG